MIDLVEAKTQMLAQRALPEGYRIDVVGSADNILVCGPSLGFCVTREAIQNGRHKLEYVANLDALIKNETELLQAAKK